MAGEGGTQQDPGGLTEEQAGRMLAGMNEVIRAGEEMRGLRAEMIKVFVGLGWTQDRIARLTDMSQPAVSKQVAKHRDAGPRPPLDLSLGQGDPPWLEGRLWGVAEDIAERYAATARCGPAADALARGRRHFTPENVDALRRLVEEDLRRYGDELAAHRAAYDEISRALDVPSRPDTAPAGPASVRRTLAHRLQRDRLEGGGDAGRGAL
ncbi:sigma-70 family RNA polymerase sigma factor [Streptomyces castrisilvae]|uniref:Sigma-70 family RNA polymerase sigma factor n=1 Tax=Streptomyces castrisilvae TaxID=3033811 RepID=A0ABY9HL60_9ACTN|nr:sigma-70 family RNA polymerase sigma factor [Streptomyces sp. Mut1]WLQ35283.1 sigma-70 family RNA polymerase sigma factor [Streptomyces sp. Mut1]